MNHISGDMKIVRSVIAKKTLKRLIGELHSMSVKGIAVSVPDSCGKKSRAREQAPCHNKLKKPYIKTLPINI